MQRTASVLIILALSATPTVAAACAALCVANVGHGSALAVPCSTMVDIEDTGIRHERPASLACCAISPGETAHPATPAATPAETRAATSVAFVPVHHLTTIVDVRITCGVIDLMNAPPLSAYHAGDLLLQLSTLRI